MRPRIAVVAIAVPALWLVALIVLDVVLEPREARGVTTRLGESLQAAATVDGVDLALIRGRLELDRLALHRDDAVGHLAIDVANVRCELLPVGLALVDRDCGELAVRGTRLEISTAAVLQIAKPRHPPIHADRVVIDDATLTFGPSAFVPGLGRIEIAIEHAEAGATVLRTPLSWLFSLEQLRARIELPAGLSVHLVYDRGQLSAAGTLFGGTQVDLAVRLPPASLAHDGQEEIRLLVRVGEDIAERLVARRAKDWLRSLPLP